MGQMVTIRGSRTTPGDVLAPGVETTVELTPLVRNLIRHGAVEVVKHHEAPVQFAAGGSILEGSEPVRLEHPAHSLLTTTADERDSVLATLNSSEPPRVDPVDELVAVTEELNLYDATKPPGRNTSREDWAEFLAQHPHGFITEGKDRKTLIAEWDAYLDGLD